MLCFETIVGTGNFGRGHFPTPDTVNESKLFISKHNITHIELIPDSPPPIFVLRLLDELFELISLLLLDDRIQFVIVAEMLELIIPSVRNLSNLYAGELLLLII